MLSFECCRVVEASARKIVATTKTCDLLPRNYLFPSLQGRGQGWVMWVFLKINLPSLVIIGLQVLFGLGRRTRHIAVFVEHTVGGA